MKVLSFMNGLIFDAVIILCSKKYLSIVYCYIRMKKLWDVIECLPLKKSRLLYWPDKGGTKAG